GLAGVLVVVSSVALRQFFLRPTPPSADKVDLKKRKKMFPIENEVSKKRLFDAYRSAGLK
ncbi:MAG: hypothetical protein MUC57_16805, partial [Desulfobacterales bacterium]|nr:hypothetical protein [Desulfobacterales bacterium]